MTNHFAPLEAICTHCATAKPASEFSKSSSSASGLQRWCKVCTAEYRRSWRVLNRERERQAERERYWRNVEHERNKLRSKNAARRERRAAGSCRVDAVDVARVMATGCLAAEFSPCDGPLTLEHLQPLSRKGRHAVGNLACLCAHHNYSKGSKTWMEFRIFHMASDTPH